jgi:ribosomal protein S18 acetylase RimI-like enzyme
VAAGADVPAVLDLWDEARSAASVTADTPEATRAVVAHPGAALLLAEIGGELVGTLVAGWDGWRGNMYRLAVRDAHRRRGVARRLVEAGEDHLRAQGCRRVTALVGSDEEAAAALWRAAGYARDDKVDRYVRNL